MAKRERTDYIVVHCSATKPSMNWGAKEIRKLHVDQNKWKDIGYHFVIKRDGTVEKGRAQSEVGAHVAGFNSVSVGVCMIGGVMESNKDKAEDNFTTAQYGALKNLLLDLKREYPRAMILGHRDLSPDLNHDGKITSNEWIKECPSFEVSKWIQKEGIK